MSGDNQDNRNSRTIESALAENRERIDKTLDELQHKFDPGEIFDQAWRYMRQKNEDGSTSRLKEMVVRNPLPITIIGAGLAWLMIAGRDGSVPPHDESIARTSTHESSTDGPSASKPSADDSSAPEATPRASSAPSAPTRGPQNRSRTTVEPAGTSDSSTAETSARGSSSERRTGGRSDTAGTDAPLDTPTKRDNPEVERSTDKNGRRPN